jgi:hypothetical protein
MTKKSFWDNSSLQQDIEWDNQELPGIPDEVLLTKNWEQIDLNREIVKNRIKNGWLEKNREAIKNRKLGYGEKISKTSKKLRSNPEWKKEWLKTIAERNKDPEYQAKLKEGRKKLCKPIMTPAGRFESRAEAARHYNIWSARIGTFLKKDPDNWYYIED